MHVGFTLVQNSLDYGFFRGIVPHSKSKMEWAAMAASWVELLAAEDEPIEPASPAGGLPLETKWQRHEDHLKSFEQLKSSSGHPSTHTFFSFFFFFCKSGITLECSREKKTRPCGGFSDRHKDTRPATFNLLPPRDSCREKNVKPLKVKG